MGSKVHVELHLFFSVERVEVVVVGELGATGDLPESKQTNPVDPIHRPGGQITFKYVQYVINNTINPHKQPDTKKANVSVRFTDNYKKVCCFHIGSHISVSTLVFLFCLQSFSIFT